MSETQCFSTAGWIALGEKHDRLAKIAAGAKNSIDAITRDLKHYFPVEGTVIQARLKAVSDALGVALAESQTP